jgi:hypothetical protein
VHCLDHSCFWHSFNMAMPSQSVLWQGTKTIKG